VVLLEEVGVALGTYRSRYRRRLSSTVRGAGPMHVTVQVSVPSTSWLGVLEVMYTCDSGLSLIIGTRTNAAPGA